MRVEADRDRCISAGRCMATAPRIFDQDDDGIVVVVVPETGPDDEAQVREAGFLCPAQAIRITAVRSEPGD
ncbi:ferredoxin [Amycolatopsis sp. GM8]|uniref:ferredoxin n=1 Tax=Amycolatopsis sp. GM8 TaxID=2896530 RepID=UPI001F4818E0|nr:ferredoxin [Amycolatopsis sp. GM8]